MSNAVIVFSISLAVAIAIGIRFAGPGGDDFELRWFDRLLALVFIVCQLAAAISLSIILTHFSLKVM